MSKVLSNGIEQGINQGISKRSAEIAQKLKQKNFDILAIIELTGLTKEEIENL